MLHRNERNWQATIFLRGKKLNQVVSDAVRQIQAKLNMSKRKLCRQLKIGRANLQRWIGKKGIFPVPLNRLISLITLLPNADDQEKLFREISRNVEEISTLQDKRWIKIPKTISPRLAEILGRHTGDGSITKSTWTIKITEESREIVENQARDIREEFGVDMQITRGNGNFWEGKINSLPLALLLNKLFGIPLGKKSTIVEEPKFLKNDIELRKAFLRGLIDTDGSFWLDKRGRICFSLETKSKKLMEDCKEIMELLEIKPKLTERSNGVFRITIPIKEVGRFISIINPTNPKFPIFAFDGPNPVNIPEPRGYVPQG
jgi:hypothetical protein